MRTILKICLDMWTSFPPVLLIRRYDQEYSSEFWVVPPTPPHFNTSFPKLRTLLRTFPEIAEKGHKESQENIFEINKLEKDWGLAEAWCSRSFVLMSLATTKTSDSEKKFWSRPAILALEKWRQKQRESKVLRGWVRLRSGWATWGSVPGRGKWLQWERRVLSMWGREHGQSQC